MPKQITRGDLVDDLYKVVNTLNTAVAAINDVDTTIWSDKEAAQKVWIAYDALDRMTRSMAVRAKLSPVEDYVTLDAIAAGIERRASQPEFIEDRAEQEADRRRHLRLEAALAGDENCGASE